MPRLEFGMYMPKRSLRDEQWLFLGHFGINCVKFVVILANLDEFGQNWIQNWIYC